MAHPENVHPASAPQRDLAAVVEEYAAVWRRTLDSVALPRIEAYLPLADADSRDELRVMLDGIDRQFRRVLVADDADGTRPNWADATVVAPPPAEPPAPAAAPGDEEDRPAALAGTPPADPAVAATVSFAPAADGAPARPKPGGTGQPQTDDARHAATVIGEVAGDASGEADLSWSHRVPTPGTVTVRGPKLPLVPGYEIVGVLGRGGMGVVYRARQQGLKRVVALKMILAGDHAAPEHVARFRTEAEAVARLQHPNIVQIFEIGTADHLPYFSLEFVDGRSLEQERDGKPLPPDRAAGLIVTLARAMHYAHRRGIVHRDLKPSNVLLTSDGVPKITDFGLVKRVEGDSSETRTGTIVGTPSYMAPEQAWGRTDVGPAADVYALGAMLYALLTGRPPFLGTTAVETIMQLREQEPVAPSQLQPNLPRDLETICLKALQKNPQSRYGDAAALADDLERHLRGEPILARRVSRLERTWRWCRRNPPLAVSGGVALVLAVCLMIGGPLAAAMIYRQKERAVTAQHAADANAQIARRNEELHKASAALAERNAHEARQNEQLAARNAEVARQQRDLSILALNTLAERAQDVLKDLPGTQGIRRNLLLLAMDGLNNVAATGDAEQTRDTVMGRAHKQMGDVLLVSGLAERAREQYRKRHEIVVSLMGAPDPDKPHVPYLNLGRSYVDLGRAAQRMGDARGAREFFLQSLVSREQALPVAADKLFVKQEIADACGHLGGISLALGRPEEALDFYRRSMDLRREWRDAAPGNPQAMREFAGAQLALAGCSLNLGRLDEALAQYTDALDTLREVAAADPRSVSSRANIAIAHNQRGVARLFAGEPGQARAEYQQALEIFDQVAREDPENAVIRQKLGTAHYGLAAACLEGDDAEAARRHFEQCAEIRRRLAGKDPDDLTLQADLMLALARLGEHEAAGRLGQEIEQHSPGDASLLYVVAGGYALASDTGDVSDALAETYADSAIAALAKAIELGYRSVALLRMDPDLGPVRDRPAFQKLLVELEESLAQPVGETARAGGA